MPLAIPHNPIHTKSMKETNLNDLYARPDVAGRTEILIPEPEPRQQWFAKWEATRPQGTYGTWNISDRD